VALPPLTDEERAAALEKAAAARRERAELKNRLKRGDTTLKQMLNNAETEELLSRMKVSELLRALPSVGSTKAKAIMKELEIAPSRRVRGLGERQRTALLNKFDSRSAARAQPRCVAPNSELVIDRNPSTSRTVTSAEGPILEGR